VKSPVYVNSLAWREVPLFGHCGQRRAFGLSPSSPLLDHEFPKEKFVAKLNPAALSFIR
jgi:hypothetical protein